MVGVVREREEGERDDRATFTDLKKARKEDCSLMMRGFNKVASPTQNAERILKMFRDQKGVNIGTTVDLYEHGLQTATRAFRDGCDEETVVVALLHDLGECWSPINHGEIVASLLRPYISPQNYWVLVHHELFQAYYYQDAFELKEKNSRDRFKDSPHWKACETFCEKYDSPAFDPEYDSLPLEHFEPMVIRIFNRKPYVASNCGEDSEVNKAKMTLAEAYPSPEELEDRRATTSELKSVLPGHFLAHPTRAGRAKATAAAAVASGEAFAPMTQKEVSLISRTRCHALLLEICQEGTFRGAASKANGQTFSKSCPPCPRTEASTPSPTAELRASSFAVAPMRPYSIEVRSYQEELKQEEDLLKEREKEIRARREARRLKETRQRLSGSGESLRAKLQEKLQKQCEREQQLEQALRELQPISRTQGGCKEGQWLLRIGALQDELKQKIEKVHALKAKEEQLEAELRDRLHADTELLPALRLAAAELCAAQDASLPVGQTRPRSSLDLSQVPQKVPQLPERQSISQISSLAQAPQLPARHPVQVPTLPERQSVAEIPPFPERPPPQVPQLPERQPVAAWHAEASSRGSMSPAAQIQTFPMQQVRDPPELAVQVATSASLRSGQFVEGHPEVQAFSMPVESIPSVPRDRATSASISRDRSTSIRRLDASLPEPGFQMEAQAQARRSASLVDATRAGIGTIPAPAASVLTLPLSSRRHPAAQTVPPTVPAQVLGTVAAPVRSASSSLRLPVYTGGVAPVAPMAMPIHGFSGGQPGALPVAQMQTMPMTFPGRRFT
ncbi:unnamed protein product [Symbiodinium sp. CCMP2592]|nr:unnamed protein product [Symbiodinium sp. CCMP2592]